MFEAVIFDWDGTLADTKEAVLASFHGALREVVGVDVSDKFVERRIGVGAAWTFKEILESKGIPATQEVIKQLVEVKIRVATENTDRVKLFPGARELLAELNGKAKLGLASMNNRAVIDHLLDHFELKKTFGKVVTVDEVKKTKPNPEIFLIAAKELGAKPEDCAVVEDSIFGVQAAKAGGMACIAVTQGAYAANELRSANPDLVVDSLLQKEDILRFILRRNR